MRNRAAAWGLLVLMFQVGCISAPKQSPLQKKLGQSGLTFSELRTRIRDLAPRFAGELELVADDISSHTESSTVRVRMARFKIDGIPQMQMALYRPDPLAAVVDAWALVAQMEQFIAALGKQGRIPESTIAEAKRRLGTLRADLERLWLEVGGTEGITAARNLIERWAAEHPVESMATRESAVELLSNLASETGVQGLGGGVNVVEETRDLTARADFMAWLLPNQIRWQTEVLLETELERATRRIAKGMLSENVSLLERLLDASVMEPAEFSRGTVTPGIIPVGGVVPAQVAPGSPSTSAADQEPLVAQLATEAGRAMAEAFSQELVRQLGPDGRGPLGSSVSATSANVAASAVGGVGGGWQGALFPGCQGPDREDCIEQGLENLSATIAAGAARGVRSELSLLPIVAGFLLGAATMGVFLLGWFLRGHREERTAVATRRPREV